MFIKSKTKISILLKRSVGKYFGFFLKTLHFTLNWCKTMHSLSTLSRKLKHFYQNRILQKITFAPSSMPKASGLKTLQNQMYFKKRYFWITFFQPKPVRKVLPVLFSDVLFSKLNKCIFNFSSKSWPRWLRFQEKHSVWQGLGFVLTLSNFSHINDCQL